MFTAVKRGRLKLLMSQCISLSEQCRAELLTLKLPLLWGVLECMSARYCKKSTIL